MNSLVQLLRHRRYFAPAWVFASLNIMIGTWVLYIPRVKDKLQLTDSSLGAALFCLGLGTLVALLFSSKIIKGIGAGQATRAGILCFAILFVFPLVSPSFLLLCLSLFLVGIASCFTDIAMNALVSEIEIKDDIHIMSASHGFFSLGGAIAALIGYFVIEPLDNPLFHIAGASCLVVLSNLWLSKEYASIQLNKQESETRFSIRLLKPLLGFAIIAFIVMGSEGAIEQWSKLYLEEIVGVFSEKTAGLGFLSFSALMALGRFFGDGLSKRLGAHKVIIGGILLALLGYFGVLIASQWATILGFGVIGLGFSVVIPELLRLAGKTKGITSAEGISVVAGAGFIGFLVSPPFVGFVADIFTLKGSFTALTIAAGLAFVVSFLINTVNRNS
ncbi:MAG: MFS transporter [Dokdonia sp.]|jgi:predicted MFS family arabinose efflux permease